VTRDVDGGHDAERDARNASAVPTAVASAGSGAPGARGERRDIAQAGGLKAES
jgi:hypothetical protein